MAVQDAIIPAITLLAGILIIVFPALLRVLIGTYLILVGAIGIALALY